MQLEVDCLVERPSRDVVFGLMVHRSTDRLLLYEGHFTDEELGMPAFAAGDVFTLFFDFQVNFVRGEYFVECWVLHGPTHMYWSVLNPAALFSVEESRTSRGIADIGLTARLAARAPVLAAGQKDR